MSRLGGGRNVGGGSVSSTARSGFNKTNYSVALSDDMNPCPPSGSCLDAAGNELNTSMMSSATDRSEVASKWIENNNSRENKYYYKDSIGQKHVVQTRGLPDLYSSGIMNARREKFIEEAIKIYKPKWDNFAEGGPPVDMDEAKFAVECMFDALQKAAIDTLTTGEYLYDHIVPHCYSLYELSKLITSYV